MNIGLRQLTRDLFNRRPKEEFISQTVAENAKNFLKKADNKTIIQIIRKAKEELKKQNTQITGDKKFPLELAYENLKLKEKDWKIIKSPYTDAIIAVCKEMQKEAKQI